MSKEEIYKKAIEFKSRRNELKQKEAELKFNAGKFQDEVKQYDSDIGDFIRNITGISGDSVDVAEIIEALTK